MPADNFTVLKKHSNNHNNSSTHQGSYSKESEPFAPKRNELVVEEVVEHEVKDPQVKQHVEVRKDVPEIPPDLKKIGITTPATSSFQTYQSLKLPLDENKLPAALQAPLSDSVRWLGELTQYIIIQSHGTIKSAHQNIVKNFIRLIGKDFGK